MARQVMLTTVDNPYDPFNQFKEWKAFDELNGYFTCEYFGRICQSSPKLDDDFNNLAVESAIDEICKLNILGIYKKVVKED